MFFEAEDGVLNGVEKSQQTALFSGNGYVTGFDQPEDSLSVKLHAPEEGMYQLWIGYNGPNGDKQSNLSLNGQPFADVKLVPTTGFTELKYGRVKLLEGDNTFTFTTGWGWYDIDYVKIQKVAPKSKHQVKNELVNPNATKEALTLHKFLLDHYGKNILSGQQNLIEALELKAEYGKLPAVVGFDLIEYSPTRVAHGSNSKEVENILQWDELGGITTLAWHWNAPKDLIDSVEQPWYKGFYTEGTTFDIEQALANPDSEDYKMILNDIDVIAIQLKRLQEANIPVLWRPLHEAEGGWFWWGAKGPEPAKKLYRLLYDRLTNVHQLNNLIWIWNSESPEWYPGDDVVDIISIDSYPLAGDYSPINHRYDQLVELVQDRKLVALTENGPIPDPDLLQEYQSDWSWFCTWEGEFINDGIQNNKEHIQQVYNHPYVLTLDELPEYKK
ncbi:beta-mannanase [Paenibacillus crassostreae]|uniref:Beta-mannanase n=1 Tax=Paenibacillus crassostreae TaxID=1763538 RepID=A0A167GMR3_9BACL|nr:beta-mannanase [Paenibacillus crassostreae]OAB77723.1 beta-mannanase [Paenibacillus crassostreae]